MKPSYTPSGVGELTSTAMAPTSPKQKQDTSSTTATVPRRSIAKVRCNRRLHMCANRKLHSSKLFCRSGPTYTPYHMMVESRPLYLLLRLIRAPLRLQRRYHADPLLKYAAIVVYICIPIINQAVACSSPSVRFYASIRMTHQLKLAK